MGLVLHSYGLYSYGLCSYGLRSHGLCSYGLYSYGLHSYGVYSYGLYSYGREYEDLDRLVETVDNKRYRRPIGYIVMAVDNKRYRRPPNAYTSRMHTRQPARPHACAHCTALRAPHRTALRMACMPYTAGGHRARVVGLVGPRPSQVCLACPSVRMRAPTNGHGTAGRRGGCSWRAARDVREDDVAARRDIGREVSAIVTPCAIVDDTRADHTRRRKGGRVR